MRQGEQSLETAPSAPTHAPGTATGRKEKEQKLLEEIEVNRQKSQGLGEKSAAPASS